MCSPRPLREIGERERTIYRQLTPQSTRVVSSVRQMRAVKRPYDEAIEQHYRKVADESGLSPTSTMADEITRRLETDAILEFVRVALEERHEGEPQRPAIIADVGCGNGYTLQRLADHFPSQTFIGVEKNTELRQLAASRFQDQQNVSVVAGDIRAHGFLDDGSVDVLVCQRVLINILDPEDQLRALTNLLLALANGSPERASGKCIFIEAFESAWKKLNEAREEFDLKPIPQAHHNLYLPDNFFNVKALRPFARSDIPPENFLSTHYYVTRVLHPGLTGDSTLKRNSEFVRFFSAALAQNVGDYSPLRLKAFERSGAGG